MIGKNWKQLFSIIAISFLCTCLFCGLTSNAENIADRADLIYEKSNLPDVYATTDGLDDDDIENMQAIEGVEKVEERIYTAGYYNNKIFYLVVNDSDSTLAVPEIREGREGVLISESYAESKELSIGDEFPMDFYLSSMGLTEESIRGYVDTALEDLSSSFGIDLSRYVTTDSIMDSLDVETLLDSKIQVTLEITGYMYHAETCQNSSFSPSSVYVSNDYLSEKISEYLRTAIDEMLAENNVLSNLLDFIVLLPYFDYDSKEELIDAVMDEVDTYLPDIIRSLNNQALVKISDGADIDSVYDALESYFESKGEDNNIVSLTKLEDMSFYSSLEQEVTQAAQLTYVFPIIFFLVSVLVILTTLSQMVIKQRSQIGALKAIGVPKSKIYAEYTIFGMIVCFIGAVLGFIVGPLLIPNVLGIKYDILWDIPSASVGFFYPMSIVICVALVLLAGVCSLLVSFSVIREKPVDTLRPKPVKDRKRQPDKDSWYSRHVKTETRMAFRNIFSNKGKSMMVVLGSLGCTALLVCGFGIMDTLDYCIALDYGGHMVFDALAVPLSGSDEQIAKLNADDRVMVAEGYSDYDIKASYKTLVDNELFLIEEDSQIFDIEVEYDSVTIDEYTASLLGAEIGDVIRIIDGTTVYELPYLHTFESSLGCGIYALRSTFENAKIPYYGYYIRLDEGVDAQAFVDELSLDETYVSVSTFDDLLDQADDIMSSINMMTIVIEVFAVLLCVVVIYDLTSLNIMERTREIATMKVLGFKYGEISKTLAIELMIDVTLGSLLGLIFGWPMMYLVLVTNRTSLINFVYHINWYTYLMCFAISWVTALIVSLLLNLKAKKISMTESLKSIE